MPRIQKIIFVLFSALFFFVPLILWPYTSEVFEFNKIVLVYTLTTLITASWITRIIFERRFVFRRTALDLPLLAFLGTQIISSLISIDPQTSVFGYYSRFNGGLLSTICYSLLYWAFVSNLASRYTLYAIRSLLASAILVSIYGILEHFGIDKNVWVQDVQSRVFSTLGQPNWLSAWLVALIPLTWANAISTTSGREAFQLPIPNKFSKLKFPISITLSILFFITFLFTKSRSGLLGFGVMYLVFWGLSLWKYKKEIIKPFAIISSSLLIISLIVGTQFTPSISQLLNKKQALPAEAKALAGPALEVGGTESGTIRKIVWKGAIDVWKSYPIFGSGVETFAYSYYESRPAEHNLVSEWDFIYNKAHNEFLNIAATSGSLGLLSYLLLIGFSLFIFVEKLKLPISNIQFPIKFKFQNSKIENSKLNGDWQMENGNLCIALLAGYVSLLVTNFFGFSVVPTQLQLFLFPAIAIALGANEELKNNNEKGKSITNLQKIEVGTILIIISYFLILISRYWYSDYLYSTGKNYNSANQYETAIKYLTQAIYYSPNQPLYHNDLATAYVPLAVAYNQQKDAQNAKKYTDLSISESKKAIELAPNNVNYKRTIFGVYIRLSLIDPNYLVAAGYTLMDAIKLAPTDAKLYYNLALVYARTSQTELALTTLQKTIDLKSNYKEARLAYAILLNEGKKTKEAKEQLEYILTKIDPNDALTKQTLDSLK